jgi:hypothetical protein
MLERLEHSIGMMLTPPLILCIIYLVFINGL